jgi:hypothetical protein
MKTNRHLFIILEVFVLALSMLACGASAPAATPTPTVPPATDTPLPSPVPTNTAKPTFTPKPTATPNVAATQRTEEFQSLLDSFQEAGYIESSDGKITYLPAFKQEWAQLGWYQWWPYGNVTTDFVFKAHFNWSTAITTSDESGCGFIFGIQDNGDHYAVFLDKGRILFLMARGSRAYSVGKTKGSGRANFGNPAEADFAVAVKGQSAFVSVNEDVTEYTLSVDQTSRGTYGATLLSGTNRDYGTRCEMTDAMFWTQK